jgi:hypothetical protein
VVMMMMAVVVVLTVPVMMMPVVHRRPCTYINACTDMGTLMYVMHAFGCMYAARNACMRW